MSKEVAEEYLSSLADLTVNSKPLINMLTMLADENVDHAPAIVQVIENHLEKVPPEVKLPILYLIDSIIKNVSKVYVPLFTQNIVNVFVSVFEKVDERTRLNMYKLRQTWADVFPARKLYVLDLRVKDIDHAWPVTAPTPTSIHFNPKFLGNKAAPAETSSGTNATPPTSTTSTTATASTQNSDISESALREQLLKKQKILIELQQKKLELQLMQSKAIIEGQENQLNESNGQPLIANLVRPPINEEAAKLFSQRAAAKPKAVVMPPTTTSNTKSNSSNPAQGKTKIAPVSTQLIEAVKSRDPRIARQVQQNKASSEVTSKEQEIYNRQLAMLKTSLAERVAPVVLSDSNVKSHITYNVQGNLETEKQEGKSKKSIKGAVKNENSSKVKSKQISSKEYKNSPTKGSKNTSSKDSRSFSSRSSQRRNHSDRSKTPPKNERSSSPGTGRNNSCRSDSKWFKDSNHHHSRLHSSKASPKKVSNRSLNSPQRGGQNATDSPKSYNSSTSECASIHSDSLKKTHRKSKKKHKKDDDYEEKNISSPSKKELNPGSKKKVSSFSRNEENHEPVRDSHVQGVQSDEKTGSGDTKTSQRSETKNTGNVGRFEAVEKSAAENIDLVTGTECVQKNTGDNSSKKDSKTDKNEMKTCEKLESYNVEQNQKSDKLVSLDLELIESSPSPEPPPPPIISKPDEEDSVAGKKDELDVEEFSEDEKETKKEITGFKDVKGISKGRNYMRRNRDSSASPEEKTVDVDLRIGGPPEKQARLLYEEEKTNIIEKSLVNVSGRDVDLRLLTIRSGSPTQKRLSTETVAEEPPKKKNKSEIFDELFGSEDVDLRKMTRTTLNAGDRLPSPPPPPVISNGPSVPQVATIAPLVVGENTKVIADNNANEFPREDQGPENMARDRDGFDLNRGRGYRRSWADYKVKPEAEIKPLTLPTQLELDLGQRKDLSYPSFDSPDKGGKRNFRERASPRGELDRLGRPLLYNKLPNDPRARRESLGVLDGRDTDLRRLGNLMDREVDTNINVNMIIAQAADQVRNGTMSLQEYNELLKQVIHVNEKQKLREAQNKSRQEMRRSQHHPRNRRSPNRFGQQNRNSPPYRHDDDRRDRRPFSDIDERLQMPWRNIPHNEPSSGFNRMPYPCGPSRGFDIPEYDDRLAKSEVWEDDSNRFRRVDDFENSENRLRDVMCNERTHDCVDVPPADPQILDLIAKDPMKSINIDGTARDIRFYGDTAVVMLSWDDPKEISFEDGIRRVVIGDLNIVCALNDPYIMFMLNGKPHRIRLGAPTRELYIDGEFYEAHFGGPPVQVIIDGLSYLVQIEGPPPQVKIGKKRTDLVCGRINMIVDATAMLPLYLDAKPQRFDLRSRPYVFRLVNHLKTLLVNEVPVDIHFGGGCRQICGYGNLHFLRLSMLPNGIEPGRVEIVNMENLGIPAITNIPDEKVESGNNSPPSNNIQQASLSAEVNVTNSHTEVSQPQPVPQATGGGPLDILTSLMSGIVTPQQSIGFNYQVDNKDQQQLSQTSTVRQETETVPSQPQPSSIPLLGGLNINDLFQRLVASGIVPTLSSTVGNNPKPQNETTVKPVDFSDPNSLRERQPPIINSLYSGIQCSSCGVRFSPEETLKYSRHLDWHFRQNRREKDAARKGQSRKWYYDVSDWIQFEEIEDLEERAQSWFEAEATSNGEENNEQEEVKSVPAPSGNVSPTCEVCRDQFETYYNEEKEEWHLKPCIIVKEKYYHPLCYEDLVNMPEDSLLADKTVDTPVEVKDESIIENIKTLEEKEEQDFVSNDAESSSLEIFNENTMDNEAEEEYIDLKVDTMQGQEENVDEVVGTLLNELINCIVYKSEMELEEEKEMEKEEDDSEEIEVLESVPVEQKKNIIDVDLIEKLDDDDDIIYQRKTPSPIVLIPPAKIKQEPVEEMESPVAVVDQTYTNVVSSIDGNVEMIDAPQVSAPAGPSKIRITFNKPLASEQQQPQQNTEKPVTNEVPDAVADESDPDPLPLRPKKPRIAQREMTVYLPCVRGTEVSGLCSIM